MKLKRTALQMQIEAAARAVLGPEWFAPGVEAAVRTDALRFDERLRQLGQIERPAVRRRAVYTTLNTSGAKLCSVLLAAARGDAKMTLDAVVSLAEQLNAWRGPSEPVRVRMKLKKSGQFRPLVTFGVEATALHLLLRFVMKAQHPSPPAEYAASGRGPQAGITRIVNLLNEQKLDHVVLFDLKNFFPSITPGGLPKLLGLPSSVIINSLFLKEGAVLEFASHYSLSDKQLTAIRQSIREGLPQGSCASPFVASLVLADIMKAVPDISLAVTFVDDGNVVTDEASAIAITNALKQRASAHPTGPKYWKRLQTVHITQKHGADFLGFRLIRGFDGKVRARPRDFIYRRHENRLKRMLMTSPHKELDQIALAQAQAFKIANPAWDCTDGSWEILTLQALLIAQAERLRRKNLAEAKKNIGKLSPLEILKNPALWKAAA
jgi:hypothetical protein